MNDLIKIAFRNIFRNSRRSLITVFISFLSVLFLVVGSSFLGGLFNNILSESIRQTGHVRITSKDYAIKERMLSLTGNIDNYPEIKNRIAKISGVSWVTARIKFAAVVYQGDQSQEGLGNGIEAADIKNLNLESAIYQGRVMKPQANDEILIGRQLAETLGIKAGDQVTLLSRTIDNSPYALKYRVTGLFDLQNGKLNKTFYIPLSSAQDLLNMADRVTEILAFSDSTTATGALTASLKKDSQLSQLSIERWDEIGLAPVLTGIIKIVSTIIQLIFVFLAGLGIANTMMMAVFERKNEIGLLKSMGMYENEITALFTLEGFILGLFGTLSGLFVGGMAAYYLNRHGLYLGSSLSGLPLLINSMIYGVFDGGIFLKGTILGLAAAVLASIFPALSGVRLKPTEALRKE